VTSRTCSSVPGRCESQALVLVGTMQPLHIAIFVGSMRWADSGLDAQTQQEAHEGRREVASAGTARPARVTVEGEHRGQAIEPQELHDGVEGRVCCEVFAHRSMEPDRGPGIHKITGFDYVLALAQGISRDGRVILEIELNFLHRVGSLQWLGPAPTINGDAAMLAQNLPNRLSGAGQTNAPLAVPRCDVADNRATLAVLARGS
jgi:hypothetical protein